jgi:hypothetical protein
MPNKNYVFSLQARYSTALSDQQKAYSENQTPRYNDTYSLLIGVQRQLSLNKKQNKNKAGKK